MHVSNSRGSHLDTKSYGHHSRGIKPQHRWKLAIQFYQIPVTVTNDQKQAFVISQLSMSGVWTQIDKFFSSDLYKNMVTVNGLYPQLRAHWGRTHFQIWVVGRTHFSVAIWLQILTLAVAGGWGLLGPRDHLWFLVQWASSMRPWASLNSQGHLPRPLKEPSDSTVGLQQWCSITLLQQLGARHRFCPHSQRRDYTKVWPQEMGESLGIILGLVHNKDDIRYFKLKKWMYWYIIAYYMAIAVVLKYICSQNFQNC